MLNEFRQDPISGDWVLFATQRGQKPQPKENRLYQTTAECPFEPERIHEQEKPVAIYNHSQPIAELNSDWSVVVFPNKFPSVTPSGTAPDPDHGLFISAPGQGHHELVVTRDHEKHFATFSPEETIEVLNVYLDRYRTIAAEPITKHVFVFHNHGHFAGASVYHNHSQIISMPISPSGILSHLKKSEEYFKAKGVSLYDEVLAWEKQENKRIIFENEKFIALCPFVSRSAYEIKIFPKTRSAYFSLIESEGIKFLAEALQTSLQKLNLALDNPDYTFFIHSAMPAQNSEGQNFDSYNWHIEIMPRFSMVSGQEFGTNVFVNTVDPDEAAKLLRETQV